MKTATLAQIGGLSGSIGDDLDKQRIKLDGDAIQLALNDPKHPFRVETRELALKHFPLGKIESPGILTLCPFTPAKFGCTIWRGSASGNGLEGEEEQDQRSLLKTTFDPATITEANLQTGLEVNEPVISGEVKRARLIAKMIQADARFAQTLLEEEGHKTLRFLYDTLGITWLEFLGTVLRDPDGRRYALCLFRRDDGSWVWILNWLDFGRNASLLALGFAILFISLLTYVWRVFFCAIIREADFPAACRGILVGRFGNPRFPR